MLTSVTSAEKLGREMCRGVLRMLFDVNKETRQWKLTRDYYAIWGNVDQLNENISSVCASSNTLHAGVHNSLVTRKRVR